MVRLKDAGWLGDRVTNKIKCNLKSTLGLIWNVNVGRIVAALAVPSRMDMNSAAQYGKVKVVSASFVWSRAQRQEERERSVFG